MRSSYEDTKDLLNTIRFDHEGHVDHTGRRCWVSDDRKIVAGSSWCDGPQAQFFWVIRGCQTFIEERVPCNPPMTPQEIIATFQTLIEKYPG
jgi:hypothetical protein